MTRGKLGILLVAIVVAAAAAFVGSSLLRREALRDAARPMTPDEQRRAEERLLDDTSFSHAVNVAAPDVSVVTAQGERVKLSSKRGKIVFVNFWATWCPPCIQEMPTMLQLGSALAAAHPGQFEMVAISEDETWEVVQQYFAKSFGGVPPALTVVRDPDTSAAKGFYCAARGYCPDIKFPESYILDRSGRIVSLVVGPRDWSQPAARQWLEFLIRG